MDVEATHPPEHLFLATHHPISMYRQDLIEGTSKIAYTEEDFLQNFLALDISTEPAFVPILGTSGTGKSHLIRWLYIRLKRLKRNDQSCKVLLIPKIGTNLKSIIESILEGMVGQEFDEYRLRLQSSSNSLTKEEACKQLLANLAIAVGRPEEENLIEQGFEYIIDGLPALLDDPHFKREYWLKTDSIISRLVFHIFGEQNTVEDVKKRREFTLEDLPQSFRDSQYASREARDFFKKLDEETRQEVVKWLNLHLDEAIAKVLNLGREDLLRLMLDVRRSLAKQGIELILLIEDFAKLQGIDREVLESVLARPQQVTGEPLCAMRTSLACTTGYFKGLVDTVRTRTSFSVNLDIETVGDRSLIKQEDIQGLVAKYLNATRLNNQVIQEWAESFEEETHQPSQSLPNACSECPYTNACHEGFGHVEDMGLYPFTAIAIERMRERVNKGIFNPRILIKEVLRYTLEYHKSEIEKGIFPSLLLHQHFGGSNLGAMLTNDIKGKDTPENFPRRLALIDLWTTGNELYDLNSAIHNAFNLPQLGVKLKETEKKTSTKHISEPPQVFRVNNVVDSDIELFPPLSLVESYKAIDKWRNGDDMPQALGQELRVLLFEAILQRIDWNSELLLRKKIGEKFFLRRNITFREVTDTLSTKLNLPLTSDDIGDAAIALQAILLYNHYGNWNFHDGTKYFRKYAKKIEDWSQYIFDNVRKGVRKSGELFDPVPAVVEILAIGSRMIGRASDSPENMLNSLFKDFTDSEIDVSNRARNWRLLFDEIKKNRHKLLEVIQARIVCVKGVASSSKIIDASQLIEPLRVIAKDWTPKCNIPNDFRADYEVIHTVRFKIDELLVQAINDGEHLS
jgi:hypothetical protein